MIATVQPLVITEFLSTLLQANSALWSILIPTLAVELGVRQSTIYAWFNGNGDIPLRHLSTIITQALKLGYDLSPFSQLLTALFNQQRNTLKSLTHFQNEILISLVEMRKQRIDNENDLTARESVEVMSLAQNLIDLGKSLQQILVRNALITKEKKP